MHGFFQRHLLHWLEAMSLVQKMPEAILALQKLEAILSVSSRLAGKGNVTNPYTREQKAQQC